MSTQRFPGEIAGASLKRRLASQEPDYVDLGFPGEIAGASLKLPARVPRLWPSLEGFPGEIAGASLKPEIANGKTFMCLIDSPAKSPGPH